MPGKPSGNTEGDRLRVPRHFQAASRDRGQLQQGARQPGQAGQQAAQGTQTEVCHYSRLSPIRFLCQ